jgi:hypothetical protein
MPATKRFAPNPLQPIVSSDDAPENPLDGAVDLVSIANGAAVKRIRPDASATGDGTEADRAAIPAPLRESHSENYRVILVGAANAAPATSEHHSPIAIPDVSSPALQPKTSPMSTRDRFMQGFLPARSCCNLELCRSPIGTKFNLSAVCIAVFPATANPPRRYIQLADNTGTLGVTVWNDNVSKFDSNTVGRLVSLSKAVMGNQNGKKLLTMARDSSVAIVDDEQHAVSLWWKSLLSSAPLSCGSVHDVADNSIVTVSGVLGHISSDVKVVNGVEKTLVSLHLVDPSGKLDIRSWNHSADAFTAYLERPVLIRRVRVASFAGTKLCELLDGTGSVVETTFKGQSSLEHFWSS